MRRLFEELKKAESGVSQPESTGFFEKIKSYFQGKKYE
jgi:hypothetical protein